MGPAGKGTFPCCVKDKHMVYRQWHPAGKVGTGSIVGIGTNLGTGSIGGISSGGSFHNESELESP